jgi:serine/threonine protein kinase
MSGNDDAPLLSAAEQIAGGVPVDWNRIRDQVATPDAVAIAEALRSLERVIQVSGQVPATWGRFQILSEIGRGTFGTVYRANDPTLKIDVALKVIRSRAPGSPPNQERALDEARRLVKVKHTNVVQVYGAERIDGEVGLSMELINGQTLDEIVRQQATFSAREAAVIGIDLCRALAAVHRAGILHGDIKAHNVMREQGGRVVLTDFGTGRELKNEPPGAGTDFAGTPLYLAPEVFAGRPRTPSSEIYSLGVLLYFLVSGTYPVEGDSRTEIRKEHDRSSGRKSLRDVRPGLPDSFVRVVERATAEHADRRYGSAGELENALARVLSPDPDPVPAPDWRKGAVFATSMILIVGLAWLTTDRIALRPSVPLVQPDVVIPDNASAANPVPRERAAPYRIESAFYRETTGAIERLKPGARLTPGDALSLQVQASIPMYFYVVNEDEYGDSYLLFPLPGDGLQNPLPSGQRLRLPARRNGELVSWQVSSTGEREHFLIVATPERSTSFDELFATLPQPAFGRPVAKARLSTEALGVLRSVGGLTASPAKVDRQLRFMPEFSTPLSDSEEPGQGVWIRHATFMNSGK